MGFLPLLVTTFIWGTAFLAQKYGAGSLGPFAMTVFRNILGGSFLLAVMFARRRKWDWRSTGGGIACGVPLFAAMLAQQIGIEDTTPGVSAFLTTNYVLFVPLFAAVLSRRFPAIVTIVCVIVALSGTYLICINGESFSIARGERWTLLCALIFSVQMLAVDRFSRRCDLLTMSATQLFVCSILGAPFLLLPSEASRISCESLAAAWIPLVYCGVFSSGIAYTLQNAGQSKTPPAVAAIILSLESVFGVLAGWIALGDTLSARQLTGCALVFIASVFAQAFPGKAAKA